MSCSVSEDDQQDFLELVRLNSQVTTKIAVLYVIV